MEKNQITEGWNITCIEEDWCNNGTKTWKDHLKVLWKYWSLGLHTQWRLEDIGDIETIINGLKIIECMIERISQYGEQHKLNSWYPGFNDSLTCIKKKIDLFNVEFKKTTKSKNIFVLKKLETDIIKLNEFIESSQAFYNFYNI